MVDHCALPLFIIVLVKFIQIAMCTMARVFIVVIMSMCVAEFIYKE